MNAKLNSITARLYRWFYNTNEMPPNLCPYFWKCITMYIMVIPYFIISIPVIVFDNFVHPNIRSTSFLGRPFWGFAVWFLIFIVLCFIFTVTTIWTATPEYQNKYAMFYALGIIVLFACGIVSFGNVISFCLNKLFKNKQKRNISESILVEFVKAKYKKYCPKINWK